MAPATEYKEGETCESLSYGRRNKTSDVVQDLKQAPLQSSGLLDKLYEHEELTPVIGRLYPTLQLRDLLKHNESDTLLRDLAITIS